mgnify:CR=1 FL=1
MTKAELYKKACMLPLLPGVYIIRDKTDTIIYIGKAKRLKTRVSQYFREGVPHDAKVSQMIAHAFTFDVIVCQSEFEALVLEASQIKAHTPKYNILLKDDKGYSYVKVTRGAWPRISAALQKDDDDADYIGPFTSSFAVREMVETAQDCFLLPRCNKNFPQDFRKGRPCLNAHIGKCMAVCSGKITCEAYNDAVQGALRMIRYGKKDIVKQLREKMEAASERLDFETAALLRDQIMAIDRVAAGQKVVMENDTEMDVIALAGTTHAVCAAVLRYRDGRLTDKREFLFRDTTDINAVREEFLPQYYLDGGAIPKTIAVDALPPDADELSEALGEALDTLKRFGVSDDAIDGVTKSVTDSAVSAAERAAYLLVKTIVQAALFLAFFLALMLLLRLLTHGLDRLFSLPVLAQLNGLGGAALSLMEGALLIFLIVFLAPRLGVTWFADHAAGTHLLAWFLNNTPRSIIASLT